MAIDSGSEKRCFERMDTIIELQETATVTRLKRLAGRLWKHVARRCSELGIDCYDHGFYMLYTIQIKSPYELRLNAQRCGFTVKEPENLHGTPASILLLL